jgi:hypothetical protein
MSWIPNIFHRGKLYEDLSEEIRLHIEERTEQLMGQGMSRREAEQEARRAFGNRTLLEERSREVWQWPTMESIVADVRFALRQLCKSPGFTATAVPTLALCIGANAVVFSLLNGLVLRPLNVPDGQNLYQVQVGKGHSPGMSYPDYIDLRDRNRSFDGLIAYEISTAGLDTDGNPSPVWLYTAAEITLMYWAFILIWVVSSTVQMRMVRTALLTLCSVMPSGRAISRVMLAW